MTDLAGKLRSSDEVPVLVLRVPALERIAWREGRNAARNLERRCLRSFIETGSKVLRATDMLAHDDENELFVAALVTTSREKGCVAMPTDCRATLARLASAMELASGVEIETGWTLVRDIAATDPELVATAQAALERGARERERYAFFSTIGHELRTPLTSIRGYLETLLEEDLDSASARRFLEIARVEAVRLGRLVDGMFDLSLLDLRGSCLDCEVSDIGLAVDRAVDAVAPAASLRRVTIKQFACDSGPVALAPDRLAQIVINLLDNAIKHGSEGGHVFVSAHALNERYLELRVEDDGPGVAAAQRNMIFALASRGTTKAPGSGIGLAVVRLISERAGGEIDVVDSALGGAQFRVRLPIAAAAPADEERHLASVSPSRVT